MNTKKVYEWMMWISTKKAKWQKEKTMPLCCTLKIDARGTDTKLSLWMIKKDKRHHFRLSFSHAGKQYILASGIGTKCRQLHHYGDTIYIEIECMLMLIQLRIVQNQLYFHLSGARYAIHQEVFHQPLLISYHLQELLK